MAKRIGIIGGGQLGMMLTEAAARMPEHISSVTVLDPTENCPAAQAGARQIIGKFTDRDAILQLADCSDIITYEIESGDSRTLSTLDADIEPSPDTLRIIQDKLFQKQLLRDNDIPVADFVGIETELDLRAGLDKFGMPALLKTRRDAYDGRGNYVIQDRADIHASFAHFGSASTMLERFVNFSKEVSVIAARSTSGEIAAYPIVENIHENSILRMTIAPARVSTRVAERAGEMARRTMEVLHGAGVFGIEMFVVKDDIMINEIAPRVHNSGHHTLQSSETSQFEQHLRAVLGLKLGGVRLLHSAIMYNLLGPKEFSGPYDVAGASPDIYLKMYGKRESRPARKLGHYNLVAKENQTISDLLQRIDSLKNLITIVPRTADGLH